MITEDSMVGKAIKTKQPASIEDDSLKYGVPVLIASYPLVDEDDKN